jgi:hypothetical protein
MTISLKSEASGKPNLDLVFDPYVQGTHPADTYLLDDSGADIALRYAPIVYGSQAAATGLLTGQSGHADINTLFAAYGTANYPLPFQGGSYIAQPTIAGGISTGYVYFITNNSTWSINTGPVAQIVLASGSIPVNSAKCQVAFTYESGNVANITISNPLGSATPLNATNIECYIKITSSQSTPLQSFYQTKVIYQNASGFVISTTTCTFEPVTAAV